MNAINLDDYGGPQAFSWTHEYLVNYLTIGKHRIVKQPLLKNAFRKIRRDDFVPQEVKQYAFEDRELEIGYGEVINKPTEVAQMLGMLKPQFGGKFLDIGTGSGWVAALLAMAAGEDGEVYSLERVQFLVDIARLNLQKYPNVSNVRVIFRDGSKGLKDYAQYDGIHIAAAYKEVPEDIAIQLKIGGRLVVPTLEKDIRLIERKSEDEFDETTHKGYFFKAIEEGVR
ncbi:MAG: protein-L-isoaspartate O-methyltransferase [Candidatus Dojkabacteria bacterium]